MLQINFPISDVMDTALRPIAQQVMRNLLDAIGMKRIFEDHISYEAIGWSNTNVSDENKDPTFVENSVVANVNYTFDKNNLLWPTILTALDSQQLMNTYTMNDALAKLFVDTDSNIFVREHPKPVGVNMECSAYFEDLSTAVQFINTVNTYMVNGVTTMDLDYIYYLPKAAWLFLHRLYRYMDPSGDGFHEWLTSNSNNIIHLVTNRDDLSDRAYGIRKVAPNCLYGIQVKSDEPQAFMGGKAPNLFQVDFSMGTQFNLPDLFMINYPIAIGNKLLEKQLIGDYVYNLPYHDIDHVFEAHNELAQLFFGTKFERKVRHVPIYDEWLPPRTPNYTPFLTAVVLLDGIDDPEIDSTTIDLREAFPDLPESIFDLYQKVGKRALIFGDSVHIGIYRNNTLIEQSTITYDPENLVISFPNRETTPIYRLVLQANFESVARLTSQRIWHIDLTGDPNGHS